MFSVAVANEDEDSFVVEHPDADKYYKKNSEKMVKETAAEDSEDLHTQAQAAAELEGRGFTDYPITYEYSLDGTISEEQEIDPSSDERNPMYTTYYLTDEGEVWTVLDVGGIIMAYPASYNLKKNEDVPVMLTETGTIGSNHRCWLSDLAARKQADQFF